VANGSGTINTTDLAFLSHFSSLPAMAGNNANIFTGPFGGSCRPGVGAKVRAARTAWVAYRLTLGPSVTPVTGSVRSYVPAVLPEPATRTQAEQGGDERSAHRGARFIARVAVLGYRLFGAEVARRVSEARLVREEADRVALGMIA
jgi:hypothetical protein